MAGKINTKYRPNYIIAMGAMAMIGAAAHITAPALFVAPAMAKGQLSRANAQAVRESVEIVTPSTPFNAAQAKAQMAKGNVEIRGALFHRLNYMGYDGGLLPTPDHLPVAVPNMKVAIYPVTDHLLEWYKLDKKYRKPSRFSQFSKAKPQKRAEPDEAMYTYSMYTMSDEYGRFSFYNMLPGKYYLLSIADISGSYTAQENAGQSTTYDSWGNPIIVNHTRPVNRSYKTTVTFEKIIEVKNDKSVFEIDARMKINN